jgi:hypothetical protein
MYRERFHKSLPPEVGNDAGHRFAYDGGGDSFISNSGNLFPYKINVPIRKFLIGNWRMWQVWRSSYRPFLLENAATYQRDDAETIAWHEAGHVVMAALYTQFHIIEAKITKRNGGHTLFLSKSTGLMKKEDLISHIKVDFAGRAAEYLRTKDKNQITTGAVNDVKHATTIIRELIEKFSMDDTISPFYFHILNGEDQELVVKRALSLSEQWYNETVQFLETHIETVERVANELLQCRRLDAKDIDYLLNRGNKDFDSAIGHRGVDSI